MTNELLPCPFCGGAAELIHPSNEDHFGYLHSAVRCKKRECRGYEFNLWHGNDEDAINKWNTRYKRTCTREIVDGTSIRYSRCSECLALIDASDLFCRHCGAEVVDDN